MRLTQARVLVVDDEDALAENLQEILEDEGAKVRRAANAEEAADLAQQPFDVALVDVRLPDATGLELLPLLKRAGDGTGEVLLVTGNASLEDAIRAVEAGAYAYVLKPFDPDDLIVHVARALSKVLLQREANALSAALEISEANLRRLVNTVQALLLVLDPKGRVIEANHAVAAATGYSEQELVGIDWIGTFIPAGELPGVNNVWSRLLAGEYNVTHENRVLRREPDGSISERWIRWRSSTIRLDNGDLRVYASGLDLTDVRGLERRARLAERLAAVGTLAAGLAHEIRNPLNAASLQLQLLERRVGDQARLKGPITTVQHEIKRLSNLVEDFLKFAHPREVNAHDLDLRDVVRRVTDLRRATMLNQGIELEVALPEDPIIIAGDSEKLEQVVHNLVGNALEAVGEGGHVWVDVKRDGGSARLVVRDNGPGIPPENIDRIFEPFFSTKDQGTGLGMAITHSLVTAHGGEIHVHSEGGATFEVLLPRHPP